MYWEQETLDIEVGHAPDGVPEREMARRSVSAMVDLALERGYANSIGDLLTQVANYRQYRAFNCLLAVLQHPGLRHTLTEREWADQWRRRVRLGETPIVLLVPYGPVKFAFDVSQTEAVEDSRELPREWRDPYAMRDIVGAPPALNQLIERSKTDGVRVIRAKAGHAHAGCIQRAAPGVHQLVPSRRFGQTGEQVQVRWELLLNDAATQTEQLATLAHELGHLYCGHVGSAPNGKDWRQRGPASHRTREYEAEMVAILAFRRLDPDTQLPPHLDQYYEPGEVDPDVDWKRITKAAARVVDMAQGHR